MTSQSEISRPIERSALARPGSVRRVLRLSPRATIGSILLLVIVVACTAAPLISPDNPLAPDFAHTLQGPSLAHLFGTDNLGRDTLSRVLYGGRPTLAIAGATVACSLLIGTPWGIVAGYRGGSPDLVLMRIVEFAASLPALVLAIAVVAFVGTGARNVVIALTIVFSPLFARVARAATLTIKERPFVLAARAIGESDTSIMVRQVTPNIAAPVLMQAALAFAYAILAEASLSFLGLGTQPPLPSWGRMLTDAMPLAQVDAWLGVFPGLLIVLTVVSLNLLGDGLRDLLDPALAHSTELGRDGRR